MPHREELLAVRALTRGKEGGGEVEEGERTIST